LLTRVKDRFLTKLDFGRSCRVKPAC
jgi:hypothetical protein